MDDIKEEYYESCKELAKSLESSMKAIKKYNKLKSKMLPEDLKELVENVDEDEFNAINEKYLKARKYIIKNL